MMRFSKAERTRAFALLLSLMLASCGMAFALAGCGSEKDAGEGEAATGTSESAAEEVVESFIPHGASYGKSETVAATTDLNGNLQDIAVTEWIKNPAGLETINDVSSLNAIAVDGEGVSFTQNGTELTWTTGGQDVRYAGTTDAQLPFGISYEYKLDGEVVDPSALKNAKGKLEVTISYENKTSGQVYASGVTHDIQMPYVMASIIAFNPEHARNITVDNGTVIDMNGQQLAIGVGMPGLSKTLGIQNQVDLPDSVTITAEILGFDMPNITTMATAQGLEMIGGKVGEAEDGVAGLFGKVATMQQGFTALSSGIKGMGTAAGQLKAAQEGVAQLSTQIQGLVTGANAQLTQAEASQTNAVAALTTLRDSLKCTGKDDTNPCGLEGCTVCTQRNTLNAALVDLGASQQAIDNAQTLVAGTAPSADSQGTPQMSISLALTNLNNATSNLVVALDGLKTGMDKMGEATATMGEGITTMLSQAQSAIYSKTALVEALAGYVEDQGAFCGSAEGMPANTTFTVTAQAE